MKTKTLTIIVAIVAVLTFIAVIAAVILKEGKNQDTRPPFTPPAFDDAAVQGLPDTSVIPQEYIYQEVYQPGMAYRTALCGGPIVEDGKLLLYLTNADSNNVWVKVRIYKNSINPNAPTENLIAESGLIKPGEYVKYINFKQGVDSSLLADGTILKIKVMGYEPDTYYSAGEFTIETKIGGLAAPEATSEVTSEATSEVTSEATSEVTGQ